MLGWSDFGKLAVSLFYRKWNEIDVYIEDTGNLTKTIYKNILNRLFIDDFKIMEVFPIGSRDKVIEESKNPIYVSRKSVFIIDGDLDSILNGQLNGGKDLFRLRRYCIENYLLDRKALPTLICEECCQFTEDQAVSNLALDSWISTNETVAKKIYVVFCLMRFFVPTDKTISLRIGPFIADQSGNLSDPKVTAYEAQKMIEIEAIAGRASLNEHKARIEGLLSLDGVSLLHYASGKDFLFPLINLYVRSKFQIKCSGDSMKVRLSKLCDEESLDDLRTFCKTSR